MRITYITTISIISLPGYYKYVKINVILQVKYKEKFIYLSQQTTLTQVILSSILYLQWPLDNIICLPRQLEDVLSSDPSLTERMIIMVSWNDLFTFVIMLMAILTYIDTHRKHKK